MASNKKKNRVRHLQGIVVLIHPPLGIEYGKNRSYLFFYLIFSIVFSFSVFCQQLVYMFPIKQDR